jgi:hypothetical protein
MVSIKTNPNTAEPIELYKLMFDMTTIEQEYRQEVETGIVMCYLTRVDVENTAHFHVFWLIRPPGWTQRLKRQEFFKAVANWIVEKWPEVAMKPHIIHHYRTDEYAAMGLSSVWG